MKLSKLLTLAVSFLLTMQLAFADAAEGEKLFQANCTACHAINDKVVGPALKDVHKRREAKWLVKWIKNSQALIKSGDPVAVQVYNENNQAVMTPFEQLSDAQVGSIVDYIKQASEAPVTPPKKDDNTVVTEQPKSGSGFYSSTTFYALTVMAIILLVIVFILYRIKNVVEEL